MVTAEESRMCQQFAGPNSLNLDLMALLQLEQNCSLPYYTHASMSYPGEPSSDLHRLNAISGFSKPLPSYPTQKPCPKDSQRIISHGLGTLDMPADASRLPQKRFLIFDQCGSQTRLFCSPSFSPQTQIVASKTHRTLHDNMASQLDQQFLVKSVVEENWGENHLTYEEDEMLEDSEEIDALLYSDSDDDDDEVTSMTHAPFISEDAYNNEKLHEVASSNGTEKRRKLLDGRYRISSFLNTKDPVERASSCTYEDDVGSSCAGYRKFYDDVDSVKREKKLKVRDALKSLEGIIPGLNSNDPLHIIEKAIGFLKSMRNDAEALGIGYIEHQSVTSPRQLA